MLIHADFNDTTILTPQVYQWMPSPGGQVNRVMLERIGQEKARATSLVEYPKGADFPAHCHPLGEEILVLSGTFTEDGEQHYPQGWYLRNGHLSTHQPSSQEGCVILVKLMQMTEQETVCVRINTQDPQRWQTHNNFMICPLYQDLHEKTALYQLKTGQSLHLQHSEGIEFFLISGECSTSKAILPARSWGRIAPHDQIALQCTTETLLYIKEGHLNHAMQVWQDH